MEKINLMRDSKKTFSLKNKLIMNRLNIYFIFIISLLLFISCNDDIENEIPNNSEIEKSNSILGKKLENPYSVTNMKIALENLKKKNKNLNKGEITTSHLYIKFKPKNEEDISLLKIDSTLNLFDYPMDYMAIEGQDNYRDPEVPQNQPTYQYAAVKINYEMPSIDYEVLEELFIPEEIEDKKNDNFFTEQLVDEALRITNNLEGSYLSEKRSRWRPAGRILVRDDSDIDEIIGAISLEGNTYIAPEGLKVRATRWFRTHRGFVNAEGYYSCNGRFRGRARYKIDWERHNFALRSGFWASAQYRGPYRRGDWNWTIENGNRHQYFSEIFRGAFHYYYKNIRDLRRPPLNTFWRSQLRIRAHNHNEREGSLGTHSSAFRFGGLGSPISIYNPSRTSVQTYATTIHELAHASHWSMSSWHYNRMNDCDDIPLGVMCSGDSEVAESWARGVEWELTRMIYIDYRGGATNRPKYTQVVVDMIDYPPKSNIDINNGSERLNEDNVEGYTIRQLEDALIGELKWDGWKNKIKKLYNNDTEENLDALFRFWH